MKYLSQINSRVLARAWLRCIGGDSQITCQGQRPTSFVGRINLVWYMDTDG
jgi:hypothetical protein